MADATTELVARRRCKLCRQPGHRRDKCPQNAAAWSRATPDEILGDIRGQIEEIADVADPVAEAAGARERIDALEQELREYRAVEIEVRQRIVDITARLICERQVLAEARRRRTS